MNGGYKERVVLIYISQFGSTCCAHAAVSTDAWRLDPFRLLDRQDATQNRALSDNDPFVISDKCFVDSANAGPFPPTLNYASISLIYIVNLPR